MAELQVGQIAPDCTLPTEQDQEISLQELLKQSEKGAVIYFYPKASTPGCTTEACDFRDSLNSLKSAGYAVMGISPDKIPALEKFREKQDLNFPLASDPEREVMSSYGAYGEKNSYGRLVKGVIRTTIVVGKDGKVVLAKYRVRAKGHVARLRKELGID